MGVWNIKAQRAEVEHRWRESRGAVSAEGVHLSTEGGVWCPLPSKFFDFRSPNGDCWCILVFFFYNSAACFTRKTGAFGPLKFPLQFTVVFQADDTD